MIIPKDPKVRITRSAQRLEIEVHHGQATGWLVFVLFGGTGLALIVSLLMPSSTLRAESTPATIGILLFALLTMGAIAYLGLAVVFNKSRIIADHHRLVYTHGPFIGYPQRKALHHTDGVKQFFSRAYHSTSSSSSTINGAIYMIDRDDHAHLILGVFPSPFAAAQIRHELQDFYGLKEIPVYGERSGQLSR